jgi:hypothetical protein
VTHHQGENAVALAAKFDSPSKPSVQQDVKQFIITFLAGFLVFIAFALLRDRARNAWRDGPASTVYGEF